MEADNNKEDPNGAYNLSKNQDKPKDSPKQEAPKKDGAALPQQEKKEEKTSQPETKKEQAPVP